MNGSTGDSPGVNSWPNACIAFGLMTAYGAWRDQRDLDAVVSFVDAILDRRGAFVHPLEEVGQCMIAHTLIELFDYSGESRFRQASDAAAGFLLDSHLRTTSGTLPYTHRVPSLVLVDTLPMVCPFLSVYGTRFGAAKATRLAVAQLDEFLAHGMNPKLGLPYHGFQVDGPEELGVAGWARGTGWLAMGLVETLAALPRDHQARPEFVSALAALAEAVRPFQTDAGLWRWALPAPGGMLDTSGTAMLGYSIERAVELGVLDKTWHGVSERALDGIVRLTRGDGTLDKAQGECVDVGLYAATSGPAPWAQGPAVALAALAFRRQAAPRR